MINESLMLLYAGNFNGKEQEQCEWQSKFKRWSFWKLE